MTTEHSPMNHPTIPCDETGHPCNWYDRDNDFYCTDCYKVMPKVEGQEDPHDHVGHADEHGYHDNEGDY